MARLSDIVGKRPEAVEGGAYDRCFGDVELSRLLSRVQSLVIRNGNDLETLIMKRTQHLLIHNLDEFLDAQIMRQGVRVATKRVVKKAVKLQGYLIEPDFLIFERKNQTQECYIIELKDGHEFDTKSSAKEQSNLNQFLSMNAMALQWYSNYIKICGFNARTREEIHQGFKRKIDISQAMTGAEFCELLGLDYERIRQERAEDVPANFHQFIDDLLSIPTVKDAIEQKWRG